MRSVDNAVDTIVFRCIPGVLQAAIGDHLDVPDVKAVISQKANGCSLWRHGIPCGEVRATAASASSGAWVPGDFLTSGPHWELLREQVGARLVRAPPRRDRRTGHRDPGGATSRQRGLDRPRRPCHLRRTTRRHAGHAHRLLLKCEPTNSREAPSRLRNRVAVQYGNRGIVFDSVRRERVGLIAPSSSSSATSNSRAHSSLVPCATRFGSCYRETSMPLAPPRCGPHRFWRSPRSPVSTRPGARQDRAVQPLGRDNPGCRRTVATFEPCRARHGGQLRLRLSAAGRPSAHHSSSGTWVTGSRDPKQRRNLPSRGVWHPPRAS